MNLMQQPAWWSGCNCVVAAISWVAWIWWSPVAWACSCSWSTALAHEIEEDVEELPAAAAPPSLREVMSLQVIRLCSWNCLIRSQEGKVADEDAAAAVVACCNMHPALRSFLWLSSWRDGNQWGASCWRPAWPAAAGVLDCSPRTESSALGTIMELLPLLALASAALVKSPKFTELELMVCCSCFSPSSIVVAAAGRKALDAPAAVQTWMPHSIEDHGKWESSSSSEEELVPWAQRKCADMNMGSCRKEKNSEKSSTKLRSWVPRNQSSNSQVKWYFLN